MDFSRFILSLFDNSQRTQAFLLRWAQTRHLVHTVAPKQAVHSGKDKQLHVQKRTAVGRQSHRSMRLVTQTKRAIDSIRQSSAQTTSTSLVEDLCVFFRTLLVQPVRVIVCSGRNETLIYPFGDDAGTDQYYIPVSMCTVEELHTLQSLVANCRQWSDRSDDDTIANVERLYASNASNCEISTYLVRMSLVHVSCDAHLRACSAEQYLFYKQVLDVALVAAAGDQAVWQYQQNLFELARSVRNRVGTRPPATDLHRHLLQSFTQRTKPVLWSTPVRPTSSGHHRIKKPLQ